MTALQISTGENWQNVAEGSIMYRMFRGWNERRQVIGKPMLAYQDAAFVPVGNIADARIYAGANLQNAGFWRTLETEDFVPVLQTNPDGTKYRFAVGTIDGDSVITVYDSYAGGVDDRYDVGINPTAAGDIIGANKINAILRRMYAYRHAHFRIFAYYYFFFGDNLGSIAGGDTSFCENSGSLFSDIEPFPDLEFRGVISTAGVGYAGGAGCDESPPSFVGCKGGFWDYQILDYLWPQSINTENNRYVWWTQNPDPFFDIPIQPSLNFQYDKALQFAENLGGTFDTRNIHPRYDNEAYWQNQFYQEDYVCPPSFLRAWFARASTNSIITNPTFADLA
jgi:hypothetical protein